MSLMSDVFLAVIVEASDKRVETSDRIETVDERRVLTSEILTAFDFILVLTSVTFVFKVEKSAI